MKDRVRRLLDCGLLRNKGAARVTAVATPLPRQRGDVGGECYRILSLIVIVFLIRYEELICAIIRPPRAEYTLEDLGACALRQFLAVPSSHLSFECNRST